MADVGEDGYESNRTGGEGSNPTVRPPVFFAGGTTRESWQRPGFVHTGEILPPVPMPPTQPLRQEASSGRGWASAPATYVLLGINCAVYIAMCLSGASPLSPSSAQIVRWGGDFSPYVLLDGQWWRLISAAFVHIGLLHLATNMWCLWNLGLLGEPLLGVSGLFAAYLITGYAGNLLSTAMHPGLLPNGADAIVGAGASGAIFGLAGVLIVLLSSRYLPLPKSERNQLRKSVIWFAVLNFVLAAGVDFSQFSLKVDNSAHFGGFVAGIAMALLMVPRMGAPAGLFRLRRNLAVGAAALVLALLSAGIRSYFLAAFRNS